MPPTLEEYEQLNPRCEVEHGGTRMVFATPSVFMRWRVETIYEKEPWTLEWIAGFQQDDVLVDVGANVGMYTIWSAATRKTRVFAFEPEAQNYALLNRNIQLNDLQGRVSAYCLGLSDRPGLMDLQMHDLRVGGSNHAVGEALDFKNEPMRAAFRQGCVVARLDELVATQAIPLPTHIKIDVDGIEPKIIAGASGILNNTAVRSLLIETNSNLQAHRDMILVLTDCGFKFDAEQVDRAMRKTGPFVGVAEYVFRR